MKLNKDILGLIILLIQPERWRAGEELIFYKPKAVITHLLHTTNNAITP